MTTNELRQKFLDFFRSKGHAVIPSASLIPENDPTVLFNTAGMQPLVPYLLGEPHPMGRRLASAQKCVRTGDIDDVGDNRHLTCFEMLGNWSLGDYFKDESIAWSFEFLTGKEWLALDPQRIYVTVFEGDENAPRDEEAIAIWQKAFASVGLKAEVGERVFAYPKDKNWWGPAGQTGPCGPDTEIYYDIKPELGERTVHAPGWTGGKPCEPDCDCGRYVEIWNNVFMQYNKTAEGKYEPLAQKNVDTGMGLERVAMMLQGAATVFDIDALKPVIEAIEARTGKVYGSSEEVTRAIRVIADHVRTATFIIGDQRGVGPSNVDQGYIVRRLIRRAVRNGRELGIEGNFLADLAEVVIRLYGDAYPELVANRERVMKELTAEEEKFGRTLEKGMAEAQKLKGRLADVAEIPGVDAYYLYESFGFPRELTEEVLGKKVNDAEWNAEVEKHAAMSRAGAEQKFAGGLADHSEIVTRYHTATHLLQAALRKVLGPHVEQRGSNITAERMRFDFSHPAKMTPKEVAEAERLVNEWVAADYPVRFEMMTVAEAKAAGAMGLFEEKYAGLGDKVKVYMVGDDVRGYVSKEICGGPHVSRTAEVGHFRIQKEEASSAGVRRIKATIE